MIELHVTNKTGQPLFVTGSEGSDWVNFSKSGIAPNGSALVAKMTKPTQGGSDHWGWIFLDLHSPRGRGLQAYVAAGTQRGVFDYCIQYGDGGNSRTGDTIPGTTAKVQGDRVILTVEHVFDPWMSRIDATRPLHRITIPGTHDSATYKLLYPSKTQNATIQEQLYMGVRHFDIRLDAGTSDLHVVHGKHPEGTGNTEYGLADVVKILRDFVVGANGLPSAEETVILQLKVDRGYDGDIHPKVTQILQDAFRAHPDKLYANPIRLNAIPEIGSLRGKLVLLRRYETRHEDAAGSGTSIKQFGSEAQFQQWKAQPGNRTWIDVFANHFEWPDGAAATTPYRNRHSLPFVIQDDYHAAAKDKASLVETFLKEAGQRSVPEAWYLNFSSTADPGKSAEIVNPRLCKWLQTNAQGTNQHGYGSILMDFVDLATVKAVIAANF